MERINILNKQGLLSDEDRKQPLEHGCDRVTFKTCIDLSEPIKVYAYGNSGEVGLQQYSRDVASFMVWWTHFVLKDLNGFSGFSNVKFELMNFKIVHN